MTLNEQLISFNTIVVREVRRFMRIWIQTILPAAVVSGLYFIIFGKILGTMITDINGIRYIDFIIPGVILMTVIQNSYSNVVSSFYSAKFHNNVEELLISPTPNYVILLGYTAGGVARGVTVGIAVVIVSLVFTTLKIHNIAVLLSVIVLTSVLFSMAGFINAVYAKSFDDISIVPTFVLTPLIYLGGVFYDLNALPPFWQKVAQFNPILYMVNAFRYGFIQATDVSLTASYSIILLFIFALFWYSLWLLKRGTGLRT